MPFDITKAERVRTFCRNLSHTKGQWAGKSFELLNWQWESVVKPLFGTLREDGTRQYRICYVEIPKKNGKSELGAALALYMLCADGESSPEVYSAAADREQAGLVYQVAAQMVRNNPTLSKTLKILDSQKRIINYRNSGFYRVLSSDVKTKHGLNPSCVIFDELHSQPNDELWRVLTSGTDYARQQQLIFVITTAGVYDKESIWWRVREKARQVRDGIVDDPSFLPVLYIADPEKDNPDDEALWARVNPSIGHIFSLEKIREDHRIAKQDPVGWIDFLRFRLNIPVKALSRWMPMDAWDKCSGKIDDNELQGRTCAGGLDLSSTTDLTSLAFVFPPLEEDGEWIVKIKFYVPEDTILKRSRQDKVHYDIWVNKGFIVATPGNCVDYAYIRRDIMNASQKYDLHEVAYDPWGAMQLATDLQNNEGITCVETRQGAKTLSEPAKDILKKVLTTKINHGGNPVLRWCTDNLVMVIDANEGIRPAKDKATERIDGFVAMLNAWSRAMFIESSVYNQRGVVVIE